MLVLQFHLFYASQEPETTEHAEQVKNAQLIKFKQGESKQKGTVCRPSDHPSVRALIHYPDLTYATYFCDELPWEQTESSITIIKHF